MVQNILIDLSGNTLPVIFSATVVIWCFLLLRSFYRNLEAAKSSGLPYVIVPSVPTYILFSFTITILLTEYDFTSVYAYSPVWQLASLIILPLLYRLPRAWTESWLPLLDTNHLWSYGYRPFARVGADVFISVSPQRNVLWTCDPEVNYQICNQRSAFPKPLEIYGPLNNFGPTLPGVDGEEWRILRKVTGRFFHEGTNREVWSYTKDRVEKVMSGWRESHDISNDIHKDLARVTFHVISRICFSKTIPWSSSDSLPVEKTDSRHKLSYGDALIYVFDHMPVCFLTPSWLLPLLPLRAFRAASTAINEWDLYVEEMREERRRAIRKHDEEHSDLLTALVEAADEGSISHTALKGNIFVFHAAGYDTTGGTLAFSLTLLACFPEIQERLHIELVSLSQSGHDERSESSNGKVNWSYDRHFGPLLEGFTGAVIAETLRLFPVLSTLPKCTLTEQTIKMKDTTYVVPSDTLVLLAPDATHRNPKYWCEDSSKTLRTRSQEDILSPDTSLLNDFKPERWLDSAGQRIHPPQGSFLGFSLGPRACIGQRFAQVEMCAALATLLSGHRFELTDSNRSVLINADEKWKAVRDKVLRKIETETYFEMTTKMPSWEPLRIVKRNLAS